MTTGPTCNALKNWNVRIATLYGWWEARFWCGQVVQDVAYIRALALARMFEERDQGTT